MRSQISQPLISVWHDVVFHVLSHVRFPPTDASSLFRPEYIDWVDRNLRTPAATAGHERSLVLAGAAIGRLCDQVPGAFLTQMTPLLFADVPAFLANDEWCLDDLTSDVNSLRGKVIQLMRENIPGPILHQLFRLIRDEICDGYEDFWEREVQPKTARYRPLFARHMADLVDLSSGLAEVQWVLCHPLQAAGRAFGAESGSCVICVGVEDAELGVDEFQPVMQGFHEYLVYRCQAFETSAGRIATRPGEEGFAAFRRLEQSAVDRGLRLIGTEPWRSRYLRWLNGGRGEMTS